jgi:hypothetical protein
MRDIGDLDGCADVPMCPGWQATITICWRQHHRVSQLSNALRKYVSINTGISHSVHQSVQLQRNLIPMLLPSKPEHSFLLSFVKYTYKSILI